MPKFSLKKLFACVTMVSLGAAMIAALRREALIPGSVVLPGVFFPIWFGGGALVGAGAFLPLGRWRLGIATVWTVQILSEHFIFAGNYYIFGRI